MPDNEAAAEEAAAPEEPAAEEPVKAAEPVVEEANADSNVVVEAKTEAVTENNATEVGTFLSS